MKKIILALAVMLGAGQMVAAKSYDEKYHEAMEKHLEVSGTTAYFEQALGIVGLMSESLSDNEIALVQKALPGILLASLEPIYKDNVGLRELRRYNRVMNKRAVRNFRSARPGIISGVVLDIEQIAKHAEQQLAATMLTDFFTPPQIQ